MLETAYRDTIELYAAGMKGAFPKGGEITVANVEATS